MKYFGNKCVSRTWLCYLLICSGMSFSGESDDDHEELYMAASSARNASSMHFPLLIHTHTQFNGSLQEQQIYVIYPYLSLKF